MKSINPTTGELIKEYEEHSPEALNRAVYQAEYAFHEWRKLNFKERATKLLSAAAILRRDKLFLAELMAHEMGKPYTAGQAEIEKCAWVCEYYAKEAENYLKDERIKSEATLSYIHYEPLGVVLAVMPWNFPLWQVFRAAAPILMAGNSMVLKHASNVSGCALAIENIFKLSDTPEGLLKTVLANNEKVNILIEHPAIKAVTLTGSVGAGKAIAAKAGSLIKKTVLELGGADAYVVLDDANLEETAMTCATSRLINGGQSCVSAKRFIVTPKNQKVFEEIFSEHMQQARMGSPMQETTTLGPMARHDLRDQIHKQVERSVELGAKLILGGKIPQDTGAFYPPTILTDVKPGMPAYDEEIFGPVASIISATDEADAIRIANDSIFGLGAAVFTQDHKKGERIAAFELNAGCCFVNAYVQSDPRLPFGGVKLSGYGRELGEFGIKEFTNIKTVWVK